MDRPARKAILVPLALFLLAVPQTCPLVPWPGVAITMLITAPLHPKECAPCSRLIGSTASAVHADGKS